MNYIQIFCYLAVCTTPLPQVCQRDGYQDPNDCTKCRCPEGFGGTYCEAQSDSVAGNTNSNY